MIQTITREREQYAQALQRYHAAKRAYREQRATWLREVWWPWKRAQDGAPEPSCPVKTPAGPPSKPLHVVVMSSSTAKLGMEWESVYLMRPLTTHEQGKVKLARGFDEKLREVPHCPDCLRPLVPHGASVKRLVKQYLAVMSGVAESEDQDNEDEDELDTSPEPQRYLSRKQLDERDAEKRRKYQCALCGSPLWQQVGASRQSHDRLPLPTSSDQIEYVRSTARRSYALATYVHKHARNFFKLLVTDEVHEGAPGVDGGV